jgi:hypothetical protein
MTLLDDENLTGLGEAFRGAQAVEAVLHEQLAPLAAGSRYTPNRGHFSTLAGSLCWLWLDLREVFCKHHYVHPGFRGSTSIKAVLPVLCPQLSYEGLPIREGATASEQWWEMVSGAGDLEKRREIADPLREYCKLDTYAMYAIWRTLNYLTEDAVAGAMANHSSVNSSSL